MLRSDKDSIFLKRINVTNLVDAVIYNDKTATGKYLVLGQDPNSLDESGMPLLGIAILNGDYSIIKSLIDNGADINVKMGNFDRTPLMMCAESFIAGPIVRLLLSNGARLEDVDVLDNTAFHIACSKNNISFVRETIDNIKDIEIKNNLGYTPLICAVVGFANNDLIHLLLLYGADVFASDNRNKKVVNFVVKSLKLDRYDMIKKFMLYGLTFDGHTNSLHDDELALYKLYKKCCEQIADEENLDVSDVQKMLLVKNE